MANIQELAKRYVLTNYGNLMRVDEPVFDEYGNKWVVDIKTNYPTIVIDDETKQRFVNVITLNRLCKLYYSNEGKLIRAPEKDECINNLKNSLYNWKDNVEKHIIKASAYELSNLASVKHYLRPIKLIITNICYNGILTDEEIDDLKRTSQYIGWINLLDELSIIDRFSNGYILNDEFVGVMIQGKNKEIKDLTKLQIDSGIVSNLVEKAMAIAIAERYSYLNEMVKIKGLSTLIHTNSIYYRSCVEANAMIKRTPESIHFEYENIYGKIAKSEIIDLIMDLARGNVVRYEEPYIMANQTILNKLTDSSIEPSITPIM